MQINYFESSNLSIILSWISCIPIIIGIIAFILGIFWKHKGIPWLFSSWLGICLLVFSPARYLIFQVALASSYAVQSLGSFASTFILSIYVPFVYFILCLIGIGLPAISVFVLFKSNKCESIGKIMLSSIIFPVVCIISSHLFYTALPVAGKTIGWLSVKDVIKATNGPPALIYKYFSSPYASTIIPNFYKNTPQKDIDQIRCHVLAIYISKKKWLYFIKYQYPEIYDKVVSEFK
jgi:hypothetical protein